MVEYPLSKATKIEQENSRRKALAKSKAPGRGYVRAQHTYYSHNFAPPSSMKVKIDAKTKNTNENMRMEYMRPIEMILGGASRRPTKL